MPTQLRNGASTFPFNSGVVAPLPRSLLNSVLTSLLCCALLSAAFPALAQTPADIAAAQRQQETIQRQEQQRLEREQAAARRLSPTVEGTDTSALRPPVQVAPIGAPCRQIDNIRINGAAALSAADAQRIIAPFTGRCLNVGDIEKLLGEITRYYIDRGLISARAYLPQQDLSRGVLEILVIEGVVEKIIIEDGNKRSISVRNVFPGVEGKVLNLRDLEQGIDQINRLSSNNARLDIQPGEQPGGSRVVVHNDPRSPYHLSVSGDNQGTSGTGKRQAGLTLGVDNMLGWNESLFATHRQAVSTDKDRHYSESDSLNMSVPFGYTTVSLGASYSRYVSALQAPSGLELFSRGNNKNANLRVDRVMYRDQSTRAVLAATLTSKSANNFLNDQFLGVSSRKLTVLDLDADVNTAFGGGVVTATLGYAAGLDALGALKDGDDVLPFTPRAQFGKVKYGVSYLRPFSVLAQNVIFTSQFSGQKSRDVLYGSEQISIGGLYSVRGFVDDVLSGDDGYFLRNELALRQQIPLGSQTIPVRLYVAYDIGKVTSRTVDVPQGRMSGAALGMSFGWYNFTGEVFTTRPISLPDTMTREARQTWFRLSYGY